jgi:hypothetical protein
MRRMLTWVLLLGSTTIAAYHFAKPVSATTAVGFAGTTLAVGRFGDIDVMNRLTAADSAGPRGDDDTLWLSRQKTKGLSDLYVQSNVWAPGGSTGWHTHPGHSLIIVTAGTVTVYEGNDPACTPHVYTQGMGFVDSGGDHVHLIRNEGGVEARTMAVQLIPAAAARRIDAPDPGNCSFQ